MDNRIALAIERIADAMERNCNESIEEIKASLAARVKQERAEHDERMNVEKLRAKKLEAEIALLQQQLENLRNGPTNEWNMP